MQWVTSKLGLPGGKGLIQSHGELVSRIQKSENLVVYFRTTVGQTPEGKTTVRKEYGNFIEASKRLYSEDSL